MIELRQSWPLPDHPLPIVIFGAGSIVTDAHIPAYTASGFVIQGIYDPDLEKAQALAKKHGFVAYATAQEAAAQGDVIFDLATPPDAHTEILAILPEGAGVLIQKPMGSDLAAATHILEICRKRSLRLKMHGIQWHWLRRLMKAAQPRRRRSHRNPDYDLKPWHGAGVRYAGFIHF